MKTAVPASSVRWIVTLVAVIAICSCSTIKTVRGGPATTTQHTTRSVKVTVAPAPQEEMLKHYGLPYYLPKALLHLTVTPIKEKKQDTSSNAAPSTVTVNVNTDGAVTAEESDDADQTEQKPRAGEAPASPQTTATATPTPTPTSSATASPKQGAQSPALGNPNVKGLANAGKKSADNQKANGKTANGKQKAGPNEDSDVDVTSKYAINLETLIVADNDAGVLYAQYKPNWFFSEDIKLGINTKQLLTTLDTTSSDRTAQVIFNLADTAANVFKGVAGGGFGFFSMAAQPQAEMRPVALRNLDIDVTFDPFDSEQVQHVKDLFADIETCDGVYVSPFRLAFEVPSGGSSLPREPPRATRGLFFREPIAVEVRVIGREDVYLSKVAAELDPESKQRQRRLTMKCPSPSPTPAPVDDLNPANEQVSDAKDKAARRAVAAAEKKDTQDTRQALIDKLKKLRAASSEHTAHFVTVIPNKYRTFAYNIARSAFVQNKTTTLTITDGQLGQVHIVKPSEAEGFTQIPLTLSQKVLALPKDLLTYRKEIVTGQSELTTAQLNAFNSGESLHNAAATRSYTEQNAITNAQTSSLQAQATQITAETNLLNTNLTNRETVQSLAIQAQIAQLKAEAARLDAEAALLKSRAALDVLKH